MRELIYLSDRKLSQFVDTGGNGRKRRVNQLGATAPMGLGGFQVGLSESTPVEHPRLAEVIRHLEKTAAPQSFTDEDLRPGQWVRFSADMIYQIFRDPEGIARRSSADHPGPPALLFWDPQPPDGDDVWPTRLLLHGSPEHLVGTRADETPTVASCHTAAMSSPIGLVDFLTGLTQRSFSQTLWFTLRDLDGRYPAEIAARVTGYARVTANVRVDHTPFYADSGREASRVVVASPLFVELAR
ncbi:SAVMC3_10250 family protein [Streptomyces sp. E11-3]|uniref:SAVMC3_10250 family protein n=1 Tax=Streptomyces sp. E11-3 TaxID=3110112 RepID=UPI00397FA457